MRFIILKENGRNYSGNEETFRLKSNSKQDQKRIVKTLNTNKVK